MESSLHTIFISYSRYDGNVTLDLADILRAEGHTVWTDVSGIPGGAIWLFEIEKAISSCGIFVVMISQGAKDSHWVRREILFALDLKKHIIPIRLEDVPMPFALYDHQPLDYYASPTRTLKALKSALSDHPSSLKQPSGIQPFAPQRPVGLSLANFRRHLMSIKDEPETSADEE